MRYLGWSLIHYDWTGEDQVQTQGEKKRPSASQGERPHIQPILPAPPSQTSGLQNREEIDFCCFGDPVCGTLLWQPQQTNINMDISR